MVLNSAQGNFIFFYLQAVNLALLIVCMEIAVKMSRSLFVCLLLFFLFSLRIYLLVDDTLLMLADFLIFQHHLLSPSFE